MSNRTRLRPRFASKNDPTDGAETGGAEPQIAEGVDLTVAGEALGAIARKAIDRKTGARGLRSIMEAILLDSMFELPSLEGVKEIVISQQVVEGTAGPLYMYGGGMRAS